MKRFFLGIRIPRRKANQGSHGKCQASESPETENPPGVKLQLLLLRHQAGDPVEAEVTTEKVTAGSDREDLDDVFTFDKPGPSRRRNSVPGMFAPPGPASSRRRNSGPGMFDPTSSQRRNSVPCAGSSNSRSQWSSDENLASEFESKLSHLFPSSNQFATFSSLLFQRRFFNCTISKG